MLRIGFLLAMLAGSPAVFNIDDAADLFQKAMGGFSAMQAQMERLNGGKAVAGMPDFGRIGRAGQDRGNEVVSFVVLKGQQ